MSNALQLLPERSFLRRIDIVAVRDLPGFIRGRHRIPSDHGRNGEQLVHSLGAETLAEEVRVVYDAAKQILGLRRRELVRAVAEGGGNVDTPQFSYVLELDLDPRDPSGARWQRRVTLLAEPDDLPPNFDEVFPVACDELVIPFVASVEHQRLDPADSFDHLVERLEDFADGHGGSVEEDEDNARASVTTTDGAHVALDLHARELSLRILGVDGVRDVMLETQRRFADLSELMVSA